MFVSNTDLFTFVAPVDSGTRFSSFLLLSVHSVRIDSAAAESIPSSQRVDQTNRLFFESEHEHLLAAHSPR